MADVPRGKILVIRGGAIGDFILTLPVFDALRAHFPHCSIEVLGYPRVTQPALHFGAVDAAAFIDARPLAGFFARGATLDNAWQEYFSGFAIIVSYLYDPDEIFQENVKRSSAAQFIQGPHRPDEQLPIHASRVFLKPLERLAIFDADSTPRLRMPPAPSGTSMLAVHPGSGSEKKNWPEQKWSQLIGHWMTKTPWKLLLIGGEAEGDKLVRLTSGLPPDRFERLQNQPLTVVTGKLAACFGFIGHDSGISHLAAAVGLPGVILWGGSNPDIWRPLHPSVSLIHAPHGLKNLPVEQVALAAEVFFKEWQAHRGKQAQG